MKLSSLVCASIVTLAAVAADGAFAGATNGTATSTTCPTGEAWDAAANKCAAIGAVNYNSSKSNSGNVVAPDSTGAPAASTSAKYHCGKGEWMNNNGDCIKNPPNNPN